MGLKSKPEFSTRTASGHNSPISRVFCCFSLIIYKILWRARNVLREYILLTRLYFMELVKQIQYILGGPKFPMWILKPGRDNPDNFTSRIIVNHYRMFSIIYLFNTFHFPLLIFLHSNSNSSSLFSCFFPHLAPSYLPSTPKRE